MSSVVHVLVLTASFAFLSWLLRTLGLPFILILPLMLVVGVIVGYLSAGWWRR